VIERPFSRLERPVLAARPGRPQSGGYCERARRILITFRDPDSLPQVRAGGCQDAVLMPGAGSGIRQDTEIGGRPGFGVGAHRRHALLEDRAAPGRQPSWPLMPP
jgi:hypothetical protein